jgi:hypothetical protein
MSTYYVSNPGGDDGNSGLSELLPWLTVNKVNISSFSPGDSILFKRGSTWREQLTVPSSGSAGNPITFGTYSTGAKPRITGADVLSTSGWSLAGGSPETFVSDTFDRANADALGTADGGTDVDLSWNEGDPDIDISSNTAIVTGTWDTARAEIGDSHTEDVEVQVDMTSIVNWEWNYQGVSARFTSDQNFYQAYYRKFDGYLRIRAVKGGSGVELGNYNVGDLSSGTIKFRVLANGANVDVKAKIWSGAEPGWQIESTDSSSPLATGWFAIWGGNPGSGNATFDNFSVVTIPASYSYTYQKALATDPGNYVLEDGSPMTKATSIANCEATEKSFYWAANVIYIHATGGGDPTSNGKVYETPIRSTALHMNGKDYLTFDGLNIDMAQGGSAILVDQDGADHMIVQNCTMRYSNFILAWVADGAKSSNQTWTANDFQYADSGLYMHGDNITVDRNWFTHIKRAVELRDVDNSHCQTFLIEKNYFSDCGGPDETNAGIIYDSDTYSDNSDYHSGITRYNLFKNIQGRPLDGFQGDSVTAYNIIDTVTAGAVGSDLGIEVNGPGNMICGNVIFNVPNIGILVNTDPVVPDRPSYIENNIVYNTGTINHVTYVVATYTPTAIFRNNVYYPNGTGAAKYYWKGTDYTFTNWKTQSGETTASLEIDPLFTNAAGGDFTLQASSPCRDAGVDLGATYANALAPGSTWPTNVSTKDQRSQGPGWEIGAYVFGQPAGSLVLLRRHR